MSAPMTWAATRDEYDMRAYVADGGYRITTDGDSAGRFITHRPDGSEANYPTLRAAKFDADEHARIFGVEQSKPIAMRPRAIRVDDELWEAVRQIADERGDNVSELVRACLARYVKRHSNDGRELR